jgi:pentatricopeptide repeat protein
MKDRQIFPTVQIYVVMMRTFGQQGKIETVMRLLEDMKETPLKPNVEISNSILLALGKVGQLTEMMKHFVTSTGTTPIWCTFLLHNN